MGKTQFPSANRPLNPYFLIVSCCLLFAFFAYGQQSAQSIGFISHHHHSANKLPPRWHSSAWHSNSHLRHARLSAGKNSHLSHKRLYISILSNKRQTLIATLIKTNPLLGQ